MNSLLIFLLIASITILIILALIYLTKGKTAILNILQFGLKYLTYILCVLAQQICYIDGDAKKKFVVEIIRLTLFKISKIFNIPIIKIDLFLNKIKIEDIVQQVYDKYEFKIKNIEKSLVAQIQEDKLYTNIINSINQF